MNSKYLKQGNCEIVSAVKRITAGRVASALKGVARPRRAARSNSFQKSVNSP